jgi:RimJ/RimL family protein N-acetyltransferase
MALVHAVIEGRQPGHVFVDSATAPRSALVFNHSGFAYALGEARPDLFAPMLPDVVEQPWITAERSFLWCSAPAWATALRPLFRDEHSRDEFHFEAARAPVEAELATGYRLQPIDEVLAARWGEGLDPWVVRIWGGPERLVKHAFGVGIIHGSDLVAICMACAIGGTPGEAEAEIEIGTAPAHRRRRLAMAAAVAFFAHCRERGLKPAWTCESRNEASRRLAEQLGFTRFRSVVGFHLRRDAISA